MVPAESVALARESGSSKPPAPKYARAQLRGFYASDLIFLLFLGVSLVLLFVGRGRVPHWGGQFAVHLVLLGAVASLRFSSSSGWTLLSFLRQSYPLWLLPVAYGQVEVLNQIIHQGFYDDLVLSWDRAIFGGHPHTWLREALPYRLLGEFLHFCYLFYILLVPILGFTLWFQRRKEAFRVFTTTVALTMYSCYLIFMFFPVQGPFYTAPPLDGSQGFFRSIVVNRMLEGAAVGAAFPSSHVAGAVAVAAMANWFSRKLFYALMVLAAGIAFGTVYGGFHYAVDALAGLAFGLGMALIGPQVHSAQVRLARLPHLHLRFPHIRFRLVGGRLRGRLTGARAAAVRDGNPRDARDEPEDR